MYIFAINAGSSSLKFQLLHMPEETVIASGVLERIGLSDGVLTIKTSDQKHSETLDIPNHQTAVSLTLDRLVALGIVENFEAIKGVGHRVVHGGEAFTDSALITPQVKAGIQAVSDLAPLHNPANLIGIEAFEKALPGVPQVAVFDTAFHQTMQPEAYMYATPYAWYEKYGVRKYGFHGTSHKYVSQRVSSLMGRPLEDLKMVVCHIGNGASLCAVSHGQSVDTSMGLTPLAGIAMGTRSGDIDPAIMAFIAQKEGKSLETVLDELNKQSGYLGLSEVSSDSRDLWAAANNGNKKAMLAMVKQAKMIADYIGAYAVNMGGLDAIVFTAGVGENAPETRAMIIERLQFLGATIDAQNNQVRGQEQRISTADARVQVWVVPTNEEVMIARDTLRLI